MQSTIDWRSLLADPTFMAEYAKWRDNPVTQRMVLIVKQFTKPAPLHDKDTNKALYHYGLVLGYSLLSDLLFELDRLAAVGAAAERHVEAMYGADAVLAKEERPEVRGEE